RASVSERGVPEESYDRDSICCCAGATSGHPAAALPKSVMNCRRLIAWLAAEDYIGHEKNITFLDREILPFFTPERAAAMFALGQKQTSARVRAMSALPPKRTWISAVVMSALCQKQTLCSAAIDRDLMGHVLPNFRQ